MCARQRPRIFPKKKSRVSKELKGCLNEKKMAFCHGVTELSEKNKIEMTTGKMRQAWEGLNALMGVARKKEQCSVSNSQSFANELNVYYCRFDCVVPVCDCVKPKKGHWPRRTTGTCP